MKRFVLYLSLWHLAFVPAYFSFGVYPPNPEPLALLGIVSNWGLASAIAAPLLLAGITWIFEFAALRSVQPIVIRAKQTVFLGFVGIVLLSLFWLFVDTNFENFAGELRAFAGRGAIFLPIAMGCLIVLGLLVLLDGVRRRFVRLFVVGAYICAPLALFSLVQLIILIRLFPSGETGQWPLAVPSNISEGAPSNVVILLFDELDYEFVFEDEQVVDKLPNFQDLAATSLVMHNVETMQLLSMPSVSELFSGREITAMDFNGEETRLFLPAGQSILWRDQNTIFDLAIREGYHPAIFGSFYPFCKNFVMSKDVDRIYCRTGGSDRLLSTLLSPYRQALAELPTIPRFNAPMDSGVAHRRFIKVIDGGSGVFTYVHYPVPHPPFRYNADSDRLELFGIFSYFDNVRWADLFLGEVMETLRESGTWDETLLVVTADHYFREKPDISDTRIPLFMKLPNMSKGENQDLPWNHRLFLPLLEELYRRSSFEPDTVKAVMESLSR